MNLLAKWPIKVIIYNIREGNVFVEFDAAHRRYNKRGHTFFKLKNKKIDIKPVPYSKLAVSKGGKHVLILVSPSTHEFYPVSLDELKEKKLVPVDEDLKQYYSEQVRKSYEMWRSGSFFQKYGNLMVILIVAIAVMLLLYVSYDGAIELAQVNAGATAELSRGVEAMNEFLEYWQNNSLPVSNYGPAPAPF